MDINKPVNLEINKKRAFAFFPVLCFVFAGLGFALYPKWTVDDAWISYRYGYNLAEQGELNWNPGENPVEGYTGVILPMLAAGLIKTGIPVVPGVKIFCLLMFAFSFFYLGRILKRCGCTKTSQGIALLLFVLSPLTYIHTLSGLETSIFILGILATLDTALEVLSIEKKSAWAKLCFLALGLSLVRPEGMLIAGVALFIPYWYKFRIRSKILPLYSTFIVLIFIIPFLTYFIWRWNYYGRFLPNTFYAKEHDGLLCIESIKSFVKFSLFFLTFPMLIILNGKFLKPGQERIPIYVFIRKYYLRMVLTFSIPILAVYLHADLFMDFSWRFFAPFFPLVLPVVAWNLDLIFEKLILKNSRSGLWKTILISFGILQMGIWGTQLKKDIVFVQYYLTIVEDELIPVGNLLREKLPANEWLLSYLDSGAIPYLSHLRTIGFDRINDEYLAGKNRTIMERSNYFFSKNPGAIVITSYQPDSLDYLEELDSIIADSRFENYVLFKKFNNTSGALYYQFLYIRNDLVEKFGLPESVNLIQPQRNKI